MRHGTMSRVRALSVVLLTAACSSSKGEDPSGRCPAFTACGGPPDGTWQLDSVCVDAVPADAFRARWPQPSCQDAVKSNTVQMAGLLGFNSGSMTSSVTTTERWRGIYSLRCMNEMNSASAAEVDNTQCLVQQARLEEPGVFSEVTCTVMDQSCDCNMSYTATNDAGTSVPYTIQEGTLVLQNGQPPAEYCSKGDALVLRQADPVSGLPLIISTHRI